MDKLQIIRPSQLLTPYVKQYWFLTLDDVQQRSQRLLPMGSVALTFYRKGKSLSSTGRSWLPASYLSGQMSSYNTWSFFGYLNFIMVVFQPAGAGTLLKIPLNEIYEQNVGVDALDDPELVVLADQLQDESVPTYQCVDLIENFLLKRIGEEEDRLKRIDHAIRMIGAGEYEIDKLAEHSCLGYKQFKRIFSQTVGNNPKEFLRISRAQLVLYRLQTTPKVTLTQLAEACHYYDKSHLIKDIKEFSGYTPGEYLAVCDPWTESLSLFRSAFLEDHKPVGDE
ncbi:MAG: helix-turn-helix transcriptional regulator [Tannerellaceae bacterium]|nr:helix-turn-helix transcriptional regulator [Tannerellaceae bacterium]MCD8265323.1 helix-turn-helix transcriptional regulator [Tannerellaceae bacterium]